MDTLVKDPVCGMKVEPGKNPLTHLGMHFAFCSEQCRQRFLASPHLYVGEPGHKAPKQAGEEVVKKRCMRLAEPLSPNEANRLTEGLRAMMGVKEANVEGDRVEIAYDLLEATAAQIEAQIAAAGAQMGKGWAERLRRAFAHYEEECELGNLASSGGPCCSGKPRH